MKKVFLLILFLFTAVSSVFADSTYVPSQAEEISTDTTNFNGTLSSADDTVQKALDNLDDAIAGAGSGDITAVGDCATGACFGGASGTTMTFKGATSGTTTLAPAAVASGAITLPAETGTVCTTGSVCSGYQASGSYLTSESDPTVDTSAEIQAIIGAGVYEPEGVAAADITDASANAISLITALNYAAMRALLDLEAGTDFLAYSAFSANGISLVGAANYAAMQALLSIDDLITLSGVSEGAAHLGTFTGSTISDNGTIKAALQELETAVEAGTGTIDGSGTTNEIPYWVDSNTLGSLTTATYPSLTELSYVKGVTSAIQTQLNAKLGLSGGTLTGEVTVDNLGLEFTPGDDHSDCSAFSATGGGIFYDDSEGKFKKCQDNTLTDLDTQGSGTDTNAVKEFFFPAVAMLPVEPADGIPPITKTANTNIDTLTVSYNDSADECRTAVIQVPSDVQSGSTVTFRWKWFSLTATSGNVVWDVRYQSTGAEGESADGTTTIKAAASDAVQGTVKQYTTTTVTETLSTLGWAASDTINLLVCRDGNGTAGTDDMTGDAELYTFSTEIPRA